MAGKLAHRIPTFISIQLHAKGQKVSLSFETRISSAMAPEEWLASLSSPEYGSQCRVRKHVKTASWPSAQYQVHQAGDYCPIIGACISPLTVYSHVRFRAGQVWASLNLQRADCEYGNDAELASWCQLQL